MAPRGGLAPHTVARNGPSFGAVPLKLYKATNNRRLRLVGMLTLKVLTFFVPVALDRVRQEVRDFFREVSRLEKSRGIKWTVKYVKTTRLIVTRYLCGEPLSVAEDVELSGGFPLWLSAWRPHLEDKDCLRILMTLLVSLRSFKFTPVLDTSTITEPWSGKDSITESELSIACRRLGVQPSLSAFQFPHMSTKRGPLGQSLLTAMTEVTLLTPQLTENIILLGGGKLASLLEGLTDRLDILQWKSVADCWAKLFPGKSNSLRKLSFFSDNEGKTRVIGILDYWSQTCLKEIHHTLNRVLKKIPTDCTYNQNNFLSCLPSSGPYYSLDLTAATDRMPNSLQRRVIARVLGEEKSVAWLSLLTDMEFTISGTHPRKGERVKYACGQPMGAYSSWPAMALTHHILVQVSALRAGLKTYFKDYALLGDDLVIANAGVADQYKILLGELAMPISETKTHVSNDTYEFAKRWVHKGTEITGFSIGGLFSVWKRYALLHNYLETQSHHGWILDVAEHPGLITALYKIMKGPRFIYEHSKRLNALYMVFNSVSKEIKTGVYSSTVVTVMKEYLGFDVSSAPESRTETWLSPETEDLNGSGLGWIAVTEPLVPMREVLKWIYTLAKKRLVDRDVYQFQSDAYKVNERLYKIAYSLIPSSVDQYQRDFMKETIPVMINWNSPLVLVLNRLIDESIILLMQALDDTSDRSEFYRSAGLSKYFVSKGVFTMRASHSITLADSAVNKHFITAAKEYSESKYNVSDLIAEAKRLSKAELHKK